ncbi:MAG TPA: hypothetical protein VHL32_08980 [Gemmatimonadaceae bacterium]|nr:hypothetical protein [Gemmatimonadaceae bacterium]
MTNSSSWRTRSAITIAACALTIAGCSETYRSAVVENAAPAVEAVLVVSDPSPPVGGALVVSVQANSNQGIVGSYTARITYDSTALRFDGEIPISDKGMRAVNPTSGLVRFAGAAADGFPDGRLATYRFVALRSNSAKTLALAVDELHMITRVDVKRALTVAPIRQSSR